MLFYTLSNLEIKYELMVSNIHPPFQILKKMTYLKPRITHSFWDAGNLGLHDTKPNFIVHPSLYYSLRPVDNAILK